MGGDEKEEEEMAVEGVVCVCVGGVGGGGMGGLGESSLNTTRWMAHEISLSCFMSSRQASKIHVYCRVRMRNEALQSAPAIAAWREAQVKYTTPGGQVSTEGGRQVRREGGKV